MGRGGGSMCSRKEVIDEDDGVAAGVCSGWRGRALLLWVWGVCALLLCLLCLWGVCALLPCMWGVCSVLLRLLWLWG